jgi:glutathione peroxidase
MILTSNFSFAECDNLLDYETTKLRTDEKLDLCEAYQGKVIVMVNTASQCGYTPQFKTLEALYQRYKDQGLVVLGFPSNDFNQEHKEEEKTAEVCYVNYGVTFQMLSTSSVKGDNANPVFKSLANQTGQAPGWNFSKYVINREGKAIAAYSSSELPLGGDLEATVVKALAMK